MIFESQSTNILGTDNTLSPSLVELVAPDDASIIGSVVTKTDVSCSYQSLTTLLTGDYQHRLCYTGTGLIQGLNMFFGDFAGANRLDSNASVNNSAKSTRKVEFASGNKVGFQQEESNYQTGAAITYNAGLSWRILPIRNNSDVPQNVLVSIGFSSENRLTTNNGNYCLFSLVPTMGTYSQVKSAKSILHVTNTSNTTNSAADYWVLVPPKTTILCILCASGYSTNGSGAPAAGVNNPIAHTNFFAKLNFTFENPSIVCDIRMLSALAQARFQLFTNDPNWSYTADGRPQLAKIWTETARLYGDR